MPRRYIKFIEGHYYHVYNRGTNKQKIFYETENYLYLLKLLKKNTEKFTLTVIAYCLMPNHFHFLLRVDAGGDLSKCLATILNSYAQAINKRYNRTGSLFAERFNAIHIDKDEYLVYLCRYIHRNPLKAKLIFKLNVWPFSNYLEFIGKRDGVLFDLDFFHTYFSSFAEYKDFVIDSNEPPDGFGDYTLD